MKKSQEPNQKRNETSATKSAAQVACQKGEKKMKIEELKAQLKATRKEDLIEDILLVHRRLNEEAEDHAKRAAATIKKYGYLSTPGQAAEDSARSWKMAKLVFDLGFNIKKAGE